MSLSHYTRKIVEARKSKKDDFRRMHSELTKMQNHLKKILDLKTNSTWNSIIHNKTNSSELWSNIVGRASDLDSLIRPFVADDGTFTIARSRINRSFVNIGAVGITREGKSEFTATTTKLDEWCLPRRGGKPCTTAPVNVINGASEDGKRKFIRVYYNTVREMAQLLISFLEELGNQTDEAELRSIHTRAQLRNWVQINRSRIDDDTQVGRKNGAKKIAFFEYLDNIDAYIHRLVESDSDTKYDDYDLSDVECGRNIDKAKAYYSSVSYYEDSKSQKKLFTSFATNRAEIYTNFEINDECVENLQFLDTPGIGEQKPGLKAVLSEAITTQLDIILIVRAVKPNHVNDGDLEELLDSIRTRQNGKDNANRAIYFVLNMWMSEDNSATYQDGINERNYIKKRLTLKQDTSTIVLSDNHFRMIRVPSQVELLPNEQFNDKNPIGTYLLDILKDLIPFIGQVDVDYCQVAISQFNRIKEIYNNLKVQITSLTADLPNDDISSKIDDTLASVGARWKKENAVLNDKEITDGIKYSIDTFCNADTGMFLCEFFNVTDGKGIKDFDADEDNKAYIDSFCKKAEQAILIDYDKGAWTALDDFKLYSELKKLFQTKLIESIFNRIDAREAQRKLTQKKEELAACFMDAGRLSYFEADKAKWWKTIANVLKDKNYPPLRTNNNGEPEYLYEIFEEFANFDIDYRTILGNSIQETMESCMHYDNFGADYNFITHENAMRAIIHSLLCIENVSQTRIQQDVVIEELNKIMAKFRKLLNRIREVNIYGQQARLTEERSQWEQFYKDHANVLFADDETEREQSLITQWKQITN